MQIFAIHGLRVASAVPLPELSASWATRADCVVELSPARDAVRGKRFHVWRVRGRTRLVFARAADGYVLRFPGLATFDVSEDGTRIHCRPVPDLPTSTLRHLLLDQVLPLALSRTGRTALHASAVHVPRLGAVAFAGETGRGKSTLAAALARRHWPFITDDCLVLRRGAPCTTVQPGYPGSRLWRETASALGLRRPSNVSVAHYTDKARVAVGRCRLRPSVLAAVFVLGSRYDRGPAACIERLRPLDACMALARYLFVMDVADRRQLSQSFAALTTIAACVPVFRLRVRRAGHVHHLRELEDAIHATLRSTSPLRSSTRV